MNTLLATLFSLLFSVSLCAQNGQTLEVRLPDEALPSTTRPLRAGGGFSKTNAALGSFLGEHPQWEFRCDDLTLAPHRAWGDGIAIAGFPSVTDANAAQAGARFIRDHAAVLQANPDELRMLSSEMVDGKIYQKLIQTWRGVDVLNSYVDLRISRDGRVFMFGSDFKNGIGIDIQPALGLAAAKAFATVGFETPIAEDRISGGTLFILPLRHASSIEYRLVYNVVIDAGPEDVWNTYVDANSGDVLWRKNLVVHVAGGEEGPPRPTANTVNVRVTGSIYKDSWLLGATTLPMPSMYVNVGGKEYITDADGRFTADLGSAGTANVVARLSGPYTRARRADSTSTIKNALFTGTVTAGQDFTLSWDSSNSIAAARAVAYHMNVVRSFMRSLDTSAKLKDLDKQITGVVNVKSTCNANWDGSKINFFAAGGGCGNTGEIADVIYHEYGHAVNQFLYIRVRGSSISNGTLGEATADITANMLRDDPRIGIGFVIGASNQGIIRNAENDRVYPKDLVGEIHDDGMILTGAVWDMRKAIGLDLSRILTHRAKYGCPDGTTVGEVFADYFIEILVADDDDGNLANGTPHSAQIIPAFVRHGIPGSGLSLLFNPLPDQKSVTIPYAMNGDILVGGSINQNMLAVEEITCVYSTDDWANSERSAMTVDKATKKFSGSIPAQKAGSIVQYYYQCRDNYGSTFRVPTTAPEQDYLFLVGFLSKVYSDCEQADGFSVVSTCSTGKWTRGKPVGTYNPSLGAPPNAPWIQPSVDHTVGLTKDKCWVTGNAAFNTTDGPNLDDVDGGKTTLTSPVYLITGYLDPVIRYYRWFSNDGGSNPGSDPWIVRISSNGGSTWKNLEYTSKSDASWQQYAFRLRDVVPGSDSILVSFVATDAAPESIVEAAVDDFELLDVDASLVGVNEQAALPATTALEQNFPNPFNPSTTIAWSLARAQHVTLRVFSPIGTLVATLVDEQQSAGHHARSFDASALPSGSYVYELTAGGTRLARSMVLLK